MVERYSIRDEMKYEIGTDGCDETVLNTHHDKDQTRRCFDSKKMESVERSWWDGPSVCLNILYWKFVENKSSGGLLY